MTRDQGHDQGHRRSLQGLQAQPPEFEVSFEGPVELPCNGRTFNFTMDFAGSVDSETQPDVKVAWTVIEFDSQVETVLDSGADLVFGNGATGEAQQSETIKLWCDEVCHLNGNQGQSISDSNETTTHEVFVRAKRDIEGGLSLEKESTRFYDVTCIPVVLNPIKDPEDPEDDFENPIIIIPNPPVPDPDPDPLPPNPNPGLPLRQFEITLDGPDELPCNNAPSDFTITFNGRVGRTRPEVVVKTWALLEDDVRMKTTLDDGANFFVGGGHLGQHMRSTIVSLHCNANCDLVGPKGISLSGGTEGFSHELFVRAEREINRGLRLNRTSKKWLRVDCKPVATKPPRTTVPPDPTTNPMPGSTTNPMPDTTSTGTTTTTEPVPECIQSSCIGDPHFTTWGGEKYDYHGACDLILLHNPSFAKGLGMHIHIRTKHQGIIGSYIETAALQIGNDVLEVKALDNRAKAHWINGKIDASLTNLGGFPISYFTRQKIITTEHSFVVDIGNKEQIILRTHKKLVNVRLISHNQAFRTSTGLLGRFDGGLRVGRDGETFIANYDRFGSAWQVQPSDPQLFHDEEGQEGTCLLIDPLAKEEERNLRRRLMEHVSDEAARTACSVAKEEDVENCVFDVVALNDVELAEMYADDGDEEEYELSII